MVDFLDNLANNENDNEGDKGDSNVDVKAVMAEMEELRKERNGLLKGMKEERSRRQELSGRFSQLQDTVNTVLSQRQQTISELNGINPQENKEDKLAVQWTEDGDGFIPREQLLEITKPYEERINQLEEMIQHSSAQNQAATEADRVKSAIIGEDERFVDANRRYQAARKWATDQVAEFASLNNVGRALTSGEALDYVFNSDLESEFSERFPGLHIEDIVTAEDSQRHFRRTLSEIAKATTPSETRDPNARMQDNRFQRIINKPAGLGNSTNQKGNDMSVTEKLAGLSPLDIMNISDDQAAAIEKAIREEENSGGVEFQQKW